MGNKCVLAADVIDFTESRLWTRDEDVHFALNKFSLIRLDETAHETRPHHGLALYVSVPDHCLSFYFALYVKEHFEVQKVVKHHSQLCEFIMTTLHSYRKGQLQVVVIYKYPKCSRTDLKKKKIFIVFWGHL